MWLLRLHLPWKNSFGPLDPKGETTSEGGKIMKQLTAASSPHIRSRWLSSAIMRNGILALIPAAALGVWFQGPRALLVLGLSILSCGVTESFLTKKAALHGAEVLTGLLLGMSLPASVSWWIPVTGGVFSVLVVKHLCGGLGNDDDAAFNVGNPADVYDQYMDMGVSMIQTDRPEFLINYLRSRGLHD